MKILFARTDIDAKIPIREHATDAGMDFFSLKNEHLNPGERKLFSTGIKAQIPPGCVLFLKDKSGLATNSGIHVMAGVIDEEYRGEIKVLLINLSVGRASFTKGQKICQGVLLPVYTPDIEETDEVSLDTSRGEGGFGSTGDGLIEQTLKKKTHSVLDIIDELKKQVEILINNQKE